MTSKNGQSIESSPFIYRQCMTSYASGYTSVVETFWEACRKTADIWRRYHRFPQQMAPEKRAQKFRTDRVLLPRSG